MMQSTGANPTNQPQGNNPQFSEREQKMTIKPRISKVSKLDGIKSWSLQAMDTCPGAKDSITGKPVDACAMCYAYKVGNYNYPNVIEPRLQNQEA